MAQCLSVTLQRCQDGGRTHLEAASPFETRFARPRVMIVSRCRASLMKEGVVAQDRWKLVGACVFRSNRPRLLGECCQSIWNLGRPWEFLAGGVASVLLLRLAPHLYHLGSGNIVGDPQGSTSPCSHDCCTLASCKLSRNSFFHEIANC